MVFTLDMIALLVIMLLIGLLVGLMISGRGKYKRLWKDERRAHADLARRHESLASEQAETVARLERDKAELERERAASGPVARPLAGGAVGDRDKLSRIDGLTPQEEIVLNEAGYHRFDQVAAMSAEQQATIEARLGAQPGHIARAGWIEQASRLSRGDGATTGIR